MIQKNPFRLQSCKVFAKFANFAYFAFETQRMQTLQLCTRSLQTLHSLHLQLQSLQTLHSLHRDFATLHAKVQTLHSLRFKCKELCTGIILKLFKVQKMLSKLTQKNPYGLHRCKVFAQSAQCAVHLCAAQIQSVRSMLCKIAPVQKICVPCTVRGAQRASSAFTNLHLCRLGTCASLCIRALIPCFCSAGLVREPCLCWQLSGLGFWFGAFPFHPFHFYVPLDVHSFSACLHLSVWPVAWLLSRLFCSFRVVSAWYLFSFVVWLFSLFGVRLVPFSSWFGCFSMARFVLGTFQI